MTRVLWQALGVVVLTAAVSAPVARADINATGYWSVSLDDGFIGPFTEHWVQTGSTLVIDGTAGSIDPQTGAFSVQFPPTPGDPCEPLYSGVLSGTVAPDGQTFTGQTVICGGAPTVCCAPGIGVLFDASGSQIAVVCGDGIIEGPETCDDGNTVAGDGCDATCQVEPCHQCSGQPSACSALPEGSACDDGNPCTLNSCDASGLCTATPAPEGSPCDDGSVCTASACDGSGTCVVTSTLDCDDGHACTIDSCDPLHGCVHTPDVRACRSAQVTKLEVNDSADDSKDKLLWKWTKGESTSQGDFGMPTGTTAYTLCVFAGATNAVVGEAEIAPDAHKWSARGSRGLTYEDPSGTADGISKIVLAGSASDRAKIVVHGARAAVSFSAPPFTTPVTAQLTNSSTNACWSATYATADVPRNAPGLFKAKTKAP